MKINDLFYTIQGEGKNAGRAALFVRLPLCNLSCPWCDTKFDTWTEYTEEEFIRFVDSVPARFAVITGGEPSMNKQSPLILDILQTRGFEVAMESNGQFLAPSAVDHLTISPKRWSAKYDKPQRKHPFWFDFRNTPSEIKLVVDVPEVLNIATVIYQSWKRGDFKFKDQLEPRFYLSPEWNQRESILPLMVEYVKEYTEWKISLQTHKILDVK